MKIISSHLEDETNISKRSKILEYTCDKKAGKINMKIVDIPEFTRRLILVVDDPKISLPNYLCCIGWNMLEPHRSPFTENIDTEIKKENFIEEDNPLDDNPNVDFFEILCKPGDNIYKFKVYAVDNEPKVDTKMIRDELNKVLSGHVLDSAEITAAHKGEK